MLSTNIWQDEAVGWGSTFDIHPKWRKSYLLWLVKKLFWAIYQTTDAKVSVVKYRLRQKFWSGRQTLISVLRKYNINTHCCNSDSCQISCAMKAALRDIKVPRLFANYFTGWWCTKCGWCTKQWRHLLWKAVTWCKLMLFVSFE